MTTRVVIPHQSAVEFALEPGTAEVGASAGLARPPPLPRPQCPAAVPGPHPAVLVLELLNRASWTPRVPDSNPRVIVSEAEGLSTRSGLYRFML